MIASTIGAVIGNCLARTPFMLIFLMGDYINALVWAGVDTIFDMYKKYRKGLRKCKST